MVLERSTFLSLQIMPMIPIQCPPGVMALVANMACPTIFTLKPLQSQKLAMAFCSSVRLFTVSYTCLAQRKNSLLESLLKVAGGGGANWLALSITIERIVRQCGSTAWI